MGMQPSARKLALVLGLAALSLRAEAAGAPCTVVPPPGPFDMALEWAWRGSPVFPAHNQVMMMPIVVQLTDDNGDQKIDRRDVPDVVFSTFAGGAYGSNGIVRAVSGADGSEIWNVTDPTLRTRGESSVAAGDIDGDGVVEIIAALDPTGIMALEHDGQLKWKYGGVFPYWGGAALADLDHDGTPEIVIGRTVVNANGTLRWTGVAGRPVDRTCRAAAGGGMA
jgi:hypothetical protein